MQSIGNDPSRHGARRGDYRPADFVFGVALAGRAGAMLSGKQPGKGYFIFSEAGVAGELVQPTGNGGQFSRAGEMAPACPGLLSDAATSG